MLMMKSQAFQIIYLQSTEKQREHWNTKIKLKNLQARSIKLPLHVFFSLNWALNIKSLSSIISISPWHRESLLLPTARTNSGLSNSFLWEANRENERGGHDQKVGINTERRELTSMSLSAILTGRGGRSLRESRPVTCWQNVKAHTLSPTLASTSRLCWL